MTVVKVRMYVVDQLLTALTDPSLTPDERIQAAVAIDSTDEERTYATVNLFGRATKQEGGG